MGVYLSSESVAAIKRSKEIDKELQRAKYAKEGVIKLLLLGTAECGKSTILKQMRILHLDGFSEEECFFQKMAIFDNIFESIIAIVNAMAVLNIRLYDCALEVPIRNIVAEDRTRRLGAPIPAYLVRSFKKLWEDQGIQLCFKRRNEFQVTDSAKYFLDQLDRITKPDYEPTQDDILRCRVKTAGVIELRFALRGVQFRMFDVGGQRSERRKWIHIFDDVQAILFIAATNEYDQVLYEDGRTNRLSEAVGLFRSVGNSKWFVTTSLILFLIDLFKEKIKDSPLSRTFPDYLGENQFEPASEFVKKMFADVIRGNKAIYPHFTCATDTAQIKFVLNASTDMVVAQHMNETGMT